MVFMLVECCAYYCFVVNMGTSHGPADGLLFDGHDLKYFKSPSDKVSYVCLVCPSVRIVCVCMTVYMCVSCVLCMYVYVCLCACMHVNM